VTELKRTPHVQLDSLSAALLLLGDARVPELKKISGVCVTEQLSETQLKVVAAARGLFDSNKVIRYRGTRVSTLTSNGSGVLDAAIGVQLANISEGSSLQALFDEVRVRHAELHIIGHNRALMGTDYAGWNPSVLEATLPGAPATVARLPYSQLIAANSAKRYCIKGTKKLPVPFGDAANDAAASNIHYGDFGAFWVYTQFAHTVSVTVYSFMLKADYEFRNRA